MRFRERLVVKNSILETVLKYVFFNRHFRPWSDVMFVLLVVYKIKHVMLSTQTTCKIINSEESFYTNFLDSAQY
jgi:hypothetical protein